MKKDFMIHREGYLLNASLTYDELVPQKGYVLYFHGGGLLFGNKDDLPKEMIDSFCSNGYGILAFEYGLAPGTKLPGILDDIRACVLWFLEYQTEFASRNLPWFLWGRSAGAYLCLIAVLLKKIPYPSGILSYYGYGFLEPDWYQTPNPYYSQFPVCLPSDCGSSPSNTVCTLGSLEVRYGLYVQARQRGDWISHFYEGKTKDFLKEYTFLLHEIPEDFPPVFLTHAFEDPDVPFEESKALSRKVPNSVFYPVASSEHDFDRNMSSAAKRIVGLSCEFLCAKCTNEV